VRQLNGYKYKQLSLEEREVLYARREQGLPLRTIALELKRSHTTLSREYRRNIRANGAYYPCSAHTYAYERLHKQRSEARMKDQVIYKYVQEKLKIKWSPETIAGRLPIDHPGLTIHFETIYRYIYWRGLEFHLWNFLTLKRQRRMKKHGRRVKRNGKIPDAISIDQRPQEVNERKIAGHWETDDVEGRRSDRSALSTTVERKTRYTIISKLKTRTAEAKQQALILRFWRFPAFLKKSITADNGMENSNHKEVARILKILMFFCHAYHSWEKGTNENTNGRIRRYIPKGKSIDALSDEDVAQVEYALNNTPRKCLEFLTPEEALTQELKAAGQELKPPGKVPSYLKKRKTSSYLTNWQDDAALWLQRHPL
jgi:IS30 family transposase